MKKIKLSPLRMAVGAALLILILGIIYCFFYFTDIITVGVKDYEYRRSGSGVEILKYTGESAELVIPEYINADKVVSIADRAFYDNDGLKEIDIPKTVKKVGSSAFAKCDNLKTVTFNSEYAEFKENTFEGSAVESVRLPNKMQKISRGMFKNCRSAKKISFPDNLKEISDEAFSGCESLGDMVVGGNILKIGQNAFSKTSKSFALSSVIDSVTESYAIKNGIKFKPCDSTYKRYTSYEAVEGSNKYNTSAVSAQNGGMLSFSPSKSGYYIIRAFGGNSIRLKQEGENRVVCPTLKNDESGMMLKLSGDKNCYFKVLTNYSFNITVEIQHVTDSYAEMIIKSEELINNAGELELKAGTSLYDSYTAQRIQTANISSDITIKKIVDYYIDGKNRLWYKINVSVGANAKRDLWFKV